MTTYPLISYGHIGPVYVFGFYLGHAVDFKIDLVTLNEN